MHKMNKSKGQMRGVFKSNGYEEKVTMGLLHVVAESKGMSGLVVAFKPTLNPKVDGTSTWHPLVLEQTGTQGFFVNCLQKASGVPHVYGSFQEAKRAAKFADDIESFPVTHTNAEVAEQMNMTALVVAEEYAKGEGDSQGLLRLSIWEEAWRKCEASRLKEQKIDLLVSGHRECEHEQPEGHGQLRTYNTSTNARMHCSTVCFCVPQVNQRTMTIYRTKEEAANDGAYMASDELSVMTLTFYRLKDAGGLTPIAIVAGKQDEKLVLTKDNMKRVQLQIGYQVLQKTMELAPVMAIREGKRLERAKAQNDPALVKKLQRAQVKRTAKETKTSDMVRLTYELQSKSAQLEEYPSGAEVARASGITVQCAAWETEEQGRRRVRTGRGRRNREVRNVCVWHRCIG
jgi:hypothetical protein